MYYVSQTISRLAGSGRAIILVTHYLEDVVPEIGRVVLLKDGRIQAAGHKEEVLTSDSITRLFDVPIHVVENAGAYYMQFER